MNVRGWRLSGWEKCSDAGSGKTAACCRYKVGNETLSADE